MIFTGTLLLIRDQLHTYMFNNILIREVMIRNVPILFVTNVKFDFKARGTQMGRPYPAQYLGRGVPGSELSF